MDEREIVEKFSVIDSLLRKVSDPMVNAFFDLSSENLLDEKIEVLQALADGKPPGEIPMYYDILELKPSDDQHWDS